MYIIDNYSHEYKTRRILDLYKILLISKTIKYCTALWVADCSAPTITSLVESTLKLYQQAGFQVMEVCDNCKFKPVRHILQDSRWTFMTNLANTQEHIPQAECNNCILKEHIGSTYHGIPYKILPRTIICYMVMETTAKLNYFPTKGGCSNYFSPSETVHHVKLDYKKHCSMHLLICILTHDEPTLPNKHMCIGLSFPMCHSHKARWI